MTAVLGSGTPCPAALGVVDGRAELRVVESRRVVGLEGATRLLVPRWSLPRARRTGVRLAAVTSVLVLLAACGRPASTATTPAVAAPSTDAATSSPPTSATPSAAALPTDTAVASGAPSPSSTPFDRTATPATTSGPLGASTLPKAAALGPGWTAYIDSGNPEDGYTGNGTPVVARNAQDTADALLPFGCRDATYVTPMPPPVHALEADYRHTSGRHAVGLALDYGTAARAADFVAAYTAALRACHAGGHATTVVREVPAPAGALATVQTDSLEHTVYRELLVPAGRVVRILDVEGASTPVASWDQIAAAFPPAP
jgi:hypothetical protein